MRLVRSLIALAVALASVLGTGCGADPIAADWRIGFSDPDQDGRARAVAARILAGGCEGTREIYAVTLEPARDVPRPPALAPGTYGFEAEARDDLCRTFARRCVDVQLPIEGGRLFLALDPVAEAIGCDGACDDGRCVDEEPSDAHMVYVAPDGDDGATGTRAAPWATFTHALAQLTPGTALVLLDGEYDAETTGPFRADCAADAMNGTAGAPIRVVAQTERQAWIRGDGDSPAVHVVDCEHWALEGIRAESRDREGLAVDADDEIVYVRDSRDVVLRRILASRTNRMLPSRAFWVYRSEEVLVEECEVYDFHDVGLSVYSSDRAVVRRSLVSARGYPSISVGDALYPSGTASVDGYDGDHGGMTVQSTSGALVENVVVEGGLGFRLSTYGSSEDNAFVGCIALETAYGFLATQADETTRITGTRYENDVTIGALYTGFYMRGQHGATIAHGTVLDGDSAGYTADDPYDPDDGTVEIRDSLSSRNAGTGFNVKEQQSWEVRRSTTFGDGREHYDDSNVVEPVEVDPELGTCMVYVPPTSPLAGAATDGGDVGANVLFRYVDRVLTDVPLWTREGRFPCFGVAEGVNDDPTTSCAGIHERLSVGTADCPLPASVAWP